jgi:hypothetical protein
VERLRKPTWMTQNRLCHHHPRVLPKQHSRSRISCDRTRVKSAHTHCTVEATSRREAPVSGFVSPSIPTWTSFHHIHTSLVVAVNRRRVRLQLSENENNRTRAGHAFQLGSYTIRHNIVSIDFRLHTAGLGDRLLTYRLQTRRHTRSCRQEWNIGIVD